MLPAWSIVFGVAFGAAVGSFLNVLIYRLPRNLSIAFPPSHCPQCGHRLGVRDLFPLLSYLAQGGKCRYCRAPIPVRYFLVELWNAGVWAWLWHQWLVVGESPLRFVVYALAASVLIAIFFIDLQHYIIPDELNVALLVLGLLHAGLLKGAPTDWDWASLGVLNLRNAAIGALVGAGCSARLRFWDGLPFGAMRWGTATSSWCAGWARCCLRQACWSRSASRLRRARCWAGCGRTGGRATRLLLATPRPTHADEPLPPEPLGNLLASCMLYTLWVDALITLLPRRVQQRVYTALGQPDEELADDAFEETPTMLPFGPFLAIGALAVMLFGGTLAAWTRAYFEWAGF
jgi:leader peptidase (prepilin peptidase)/N-methyltransferase